VSSFGWHLRSATWLALLREAVSGRPRRVGAEGVKQYDRPARLVSVVNLMWFLPTTHPEVATRPPDTFGDCAAAMAKVFTRWP